MMNVLENHIRRLDRRLAMMNHKSERLMQWRLATFFGGVIVVFVGLANSILAGLVAAIAALSVFLWVVSIHRQVQKMIDQLRTLRRIKATHLARQQLDWDNIPPEEADSPENHPFAFDIDVVGPFSLHRLLDTTMSIGGNQRLQSWLLHTHPQIDSTRHRQQLVKELLPLNNFRDRLTMSATVNTYQAAGKWDGEFLLRWLRTDNAGVQIPLRLLVGLWALCLLTISLFILSAGVGLPPLWLGSFGLYVVVGGSLMQRSAGAFGEAMGLQASVQRLQEVFRYLESYSFQQKPNLQSLCEPFQRQRPSMYLQRIRVITSALSLQGNVVVWFMLNLIVPWDLTFVYLLGRSKGQLADVLPTWLDIWYELEALSSLATFAYLNPGTSFPEVTSDALFAGEALGHPLIVNNERVCNDFSFDRLGQTVIVTGSNMSGKSTFLRTLGLNLVLAYSGSTTCSGKLSIGTFRLFTSIRVSDSVVDGFSYFYAEVRRLKALLDALHEDDAMPLFFLIDEIFRGTNNQERLIGSQSYIQALSGGNGLGMISTHDLELVKLDDIDNYHFREDVVEGKMHFDYTLRPGPSPTTNALKIMQLEGLPIRMDKV